VEPRRFRQEGRRFRDETAAGRRRCWDHIGSGGITILNNNDYVVDSPDWNSNAGQVTQGMPLTGVSGLVSASNRPDPESPVVDKVGRRRNQSLYPMATILWSRLSSNGSAGAVTWVDSSVGVVGQLAAPTALVGAEGGDHYRQAGGITILADGNMLSSPLLDGAWLRSPGAAKRTA